MADSKISDLTELTSIEASDLLVIVDDPSGTPVTKKIPLNTVNTPIFGKELSADPSDPTEGQFVIWMSDGVGSGDDGDIMLKITAGGTTKTITLVDFSAS